MKIKRRKLIALLLSLVMICSLMVNVSYNPSAEGKSMALPNSSVKVVTLVNGVETDLTDNTVLNNGDEVRVLLSWSISNLSTDPIYADTDLYYNLNATGMVISNSSGSVLQNNIAVGTYSIDEKGVLHIYITDSTLLSQSDIKGGLSIDAVIDVSGRPEDNKGQATASIAGTTITVQKSDPTSIPSVSKSRSGGVYSVNGKNYQDFTVVVTENGNATSLTFTDVFGDYLSYVSGSMKLDGEAVTPTGSGSQIAYTITNPTKGQQYTFTYTAEISDEAFANNYYYSSSDSDMYNTAEVSNSNDKSNSSYTFGLGSKTWASKWGYYDSNNNDMYWSITVNDGDEIDMSGTHVTDTLPEGTKITGDVTIKDSSGTVIATVSGEEFTNSGYTFPDGSIGKYTIEYRTAITGSTDGIASTEFKNKVNVTNSTYNVNQSVESSVWVSHNWISKSYTSVNKDDSTITWQSVITIPSTQTDSISLTFKDTLGTGLTLDEKTFSVNYGTTSVTNAYTSGVTVSGQSFVAALGEVKYVEGTDNKIVITYTTEYDAGDAEQYDFVNTSYVIDKDGDSKEATSTYRYEEASVKIVQYKWSDGTDGTKSKWGIQVVNTGSLYQDVLDGKKVYIYDTPTLTDSNGNAIDATFEVVPGSITAGGNATDLITASTEDGKTIKFDLTEYIKANPYTNYFELKYSVDLSDATIRELLDDGYTSTIMSNEATGYLDDDTDEGQKLGSVVGNGKAYPTLGTLLTKSYNYTATTAPYAEYTIDINPNAYDLIEGDGTLSIEDVMGKDLQIDISTVKLVKADGSAVTGITTNFKQTSSGNVLVIDNIPDATHLILSYSVLVNVDYNNGSTFESQGSNIDVSNACSLYATTDTFSSTEVKLTGTVQKSSAWATSDYGSIIISKHNGLNPLGGAEFELTAYELSAYETTMVENLDYEDDYGSKGVTTGVIITGSDGKKTVNLLFDVLYKINETVAPDGYVLSGKAMYVVIPGDDYGEIETAISNFATDAGITVNEITSGSILYVENEEATTDSYAVSIVKVDQNGDEVADAGFTLYMENDESNFGPTTIIGTTDENGRLTFTGLSAGTYKIVETAVPTGYDGTTPYESDSFELNDSNKIVTINAVNTKLTGTWTINKTASDTGNALPGVTFGLYDEDGNCLDTDVSDDEGKVVFDNLDLNEKYTVKEIATVDGYILDETERNTTFTVDDLTETTDIVNEKESGTIKITKTVAGSDPVKYVDGAVYTLYDSELNIIYGADKKPVTETTVNGIATFTNLEFGTYYVRETEAPADYELDSSFYEAVVVNSNTEVFTVERTNTKKVVVDPYVSFKFIKYGYDEQGDSNSQKVLPGAKFNLYRCEGDDLTLVDTAISDADGYVYFMNVTRAYIKDGETIYYEYVIKEDEAPNGYLKDTTVIEIDAENLGDYVHPDKYDLDKKGDVNELKINSSAVSYANYELTGQITLTKTNKAGTFLPGAKYAAYKNGSTTPSAATVTGDDGTLTFTGLTYGATYVIKEIEAPKGYTVSDEEFTVTVGSTSSAMGFAGMSDDYVSGVDNIYTYEIEAVDEALEVSISKQSVAGSGEISGAKLTLTDVSGNVIDSWTSGSEKHTIDSSKLQVNTVYTLTETAAPDGYGYSDSVSFMIDETGTVTLMTGSDENADVDGTTVIMKDKAIGFKLAKVDITTGNRILNAQLSITDASGAELAIWYSTTGSDFEITSDNANLYGIKVPDTKGSYNKYIFTETSAPNGYKLADDIPFYIDYYGQIYLMDSTGNYVAVENNRIIMEDSPITGGIVISKKAIAGGSELIGAQLTITNKDTGDEVDSWKSTSKAHTIAADKFVPGKTYVLTEISAPTGYAYAESIEFTVLDDGTVQVNGEDKGSLDDGVTIYMIDNAIDVKVNKISNGGKAVTGAILTIYDEAGNSVYQFESGTSSKSIGSYLKAGTYDEITDTETLSKYRLVETKTPFGYKKAEDIYFAIDSKGNLYISINLGVTYALETDATLTMIDVAKTMNISKIDINNSQELDGAKLAITDEDGNEVTSWESDSNGPKELSIPENFEVGKDYTLTETTAPYGYAIAESITFKFDENGNILIKMADGSYTDFGTDTIVMEDDYSYVYISKVDITNDKELPGAQLTITDEDGNVIDKWTSTTKAHEILVNTLSPGVKYTLTEISAPEGYEIAESIVFRVNSDGTVSVKNGDSWIVMMDGVVVMEDEVSTTDTTETTETTATTTETSESGGLDDPSDGSGTPGTPSTETSTSTSTSSSDTNVKTGDSAPINMVFLLMVMSGIGMLIFGSKRKKRSED